MSAVAWHDDVWMPDLACAAWADSFWHLKPADTCNSMRTLSVVDSALRWGATLQQFPFASAASQLIVAFVDVVVACVTDVFDVNLQLQHRSSASAKAEWIIEGVAFRGEQEAGFLVHRAGL